MKIRSGFVSNSSSSSFVIIGFKLPTDDESKKKFLKYKGIEIPEDDDDLWSAYSDALYDTSSVLTGDGEYWAGKIISDSNGNDCGDMERNEIDITAAIAEAEAMREIFDIDPSVPVKLITGERSC